jgi:hypothetical protein
VVHFGTRWGLVEKQNDPTELIEGKREQKGKKVHGACSMVHCSAVECSVQWNIIVQKEGSNSCVEAHILSACATIMNKKSNKFRPLKSETPKTSTSMPKFGWNAKNLVELTIKCFN